MAQSKQSVRDAIAGDPAVAAFQVSFAVIVFLATVTGLLLIGTGINYLRTPELTPSKPVVPSRLETATNYGTVSHPQTTISASSIQSGSSAPVQQAASADQIQPAPLR